MNANAILQPVFVMALLTLVMTLWMYATRIPAMSKAGIDPQEARDTDQLASLPLAVRQVADNYNHLFEQPTVFYAVAIAIAVLGHVDTLHVVCAWLFAILRIAHSIVQATFNVVLLRFSIFSLAWAALGIMIVRESLRVF